MATKIEQITSEPTRVPAADPFALLEYLDSLVEDLRGHVRKALAETDTEAIHDARVATRRLSAAMNLLEPLLKDDIHGPFKAVLKKLRRRLGPLRDMDVMIGHAEELPRTGGGAGAAVWLTRELSERRDAERKHTRRKESPSKLLAKVDGWLEVREQLAKSKSEIDAIVTQSVHLQLDSFAEQANQLATGQAGVDVHELRIAGKSLRYTLELAAAHGQKLPKKLFASFKQMQEALGLWHDFVVMTERAMGLSVETELPSREPILQINVLNLARLFLKRASRELATFTRLWTGSGERLATTIRESFPIHYAITEPKTDLDPSRSDETPAPQAPPQDAPSAEQA